MIQFNNEALRNTTSIEAAAEEHENNKGKFIFESKAELEACLDVRHAGEVLFAGSVAKQFDCEVSRVFELIDENSQDYEAVMKIVFDDFRNKRMDD